MAKKQDIIHQKNGKYQTLYILGAKLFWAKVFKPETDEFSGKKQYSVTVFVTEDQKDKMEDLGVNKQFSQVDKDKIKRGPNKGKVKFSSEKYDGTEGMYGFNLTVDAEYKDGNPRKPPVIVAADGKTRIKTEVGNGSIGNIRCDARIYEKVDPDMLCLSLNLIQVTELVEYQSGAVKDDVLNIELEAEDDSDNIIDSSDDAPFDTGDDNDDEEY